MVDSFGSLHEDFITLVNEIEETAMRGLGQPPPFRITRETFLSLLSSEWQTSNAAIIAQWLCLCQRLRLRGISRSAAPVAAAASTAGHFQDLHDVTICNDDDAFVSTDDDACNSVDDAEDDLSQPVVTAAFSVVVCDGFPVIT